MRRILFVVAVVVLAMTGSTPIFASHGSTHQMIVKLDGTGSGTVTSTPPGISCPPDCTEWYPVSVTKVDLLAEPAAGSAFAAWLGSVCDNTAPVYPNPCSVPMTNKRTITATFDAGSPPPPPPPPPPDETLRIAAAGDICGNLTRCAETAARMQDSITNDGVDLIVTQGDNDQTNGLLDEYLTKYHPRWGVPTIFDRTLVAMGNHDCYDTPRGNETSVKEGCSGAVAYFGSDATIVDRINANTPFVATDLAGVDVPPFTYVAEAGDWLIVVLNSAGDVGSGRATEVERDAQTQLLAAVLDADTTHSCEMVVWHHPRYASGKHGNNVWFDAWADVAYTRGVDLVLSGHDHVYERYAKQNGDDLAASDGFRQFVLGTGGAGLNSTFQDRPSREVLIRDHGVTVFELGDGAYSWQFRDHQTNAIDDSGNDTCVTPPDPGASG